MDNKGNQNKNGKNPRGQNYAVLIMTMLFTLLCVAMMHNLWQGSRTHKMPYSEFNQMLKDHEVESVVIGNGKIQITPKEDSKKYGGSQSAGASRSAGNFPAKVPVPPAAPGRTGTYRLWNACPWTHV